MSDYTVSGISYDTITESGVYELSAEGAEGGAAKYPSRGVGGLGEAVSGDIYLTQGTVLELVVGGAGGRGAFGGGGGGGGSFVFETLSGSLDPLLVAGGGGGAGLYDGGGDARSGPTGGNGNGSGPGGAPAGAGGKDGKAGGGASSYGGGGGGYTGGGEGGARGSTLGQTFAGGSGNSGGGGGGIGGGGVGGIGGGGGGGYGGGGGGGSYLSSELLPRTTTDTIGTGSATGDGDVVVTFLETGICYLRGTRILTATGEVAVEDLGIGDRVITRFGGTRAIKWIGRQVFAGDEAAEYPVHIRAGALGDAMPARDLWVSPGHSMLIEDRLILAKLLVNGVTVTQGPAPGAWIEYFNLDLGVHDCVIAEGAWSESYADAPGMRALFHNAASFEARYPHAPPASGLVLCAERPEHGPRLNEVLRPVVARAAVGISSGRLEGYVERVENVWTVIGWARDVVNMALPVLLEVCVGDEVLGAVLACDYRADLAAAGKGSGRCAFSFTAPRRLTPEMQAVLHVRRAADGASLAPATRAVEAPRLRLVS